MGYVWIVLIKSQTAQKFWSYNLKLFVCEADKLKYFLWRGKTTEKIIEKFIDLASINGLFRFAMQTLKNFQQYSVVT